jgi:hypothetical protein
MALLLIGPENFVDLVVNLWSWWVPINLSG